MVPGYGLEIIGSPFTLSQERRTQTVFVVDIFTAGRTFGTEGPSTVRVTLGPLHFYNDPIFDVGVYTTVGKGVTDGANGLPDSHVTLLHRDLACGYPICVKVRVDAHDTVTPFYTLSLSITRSVFLMVSPFSDFR